MRVLIGCEFSGVVREQFKSMGEIMNKDITFCSACPSLCNKIRECERHVRNHEKLDYWQSVTDFSSIQENVECGFFIKIAE